MIRAAIRSDLVELRTVSWAYRAANIALAQKSLPQSALDLRGEVDQHHVYLFRDTRITAYLIGYPDGDCFYIDALHSLPKVYTRNMERQLLTYAEIKADEAGCDYIGILDEPLMKWVVSHYRALRWTEVQVEDPEGRVYFEMHSKRAAHTAAGPVHVMH